MRLRMDNPVLDYINTVVQFIALNLVFVLCCLPLFTIGPALAALYQVTLQEARKEHGALIRPFFRHFKEMLVQGIFTFVFFVLLLFVIAYAMTFWHALGGTISIIATVFTVLMATVVFLAFTYVFPLMARFENSFWRTIKNAFLLSIANPKVSMLLLLIQLFAFSILYLFPVAKVFLILIGFAFLAYCNSLIFTRLFRQYEPEHR